MRFLEGQNGHHGVRAPEKKTSPLKGCVRTTTPVTTDARDPNSQGAQRITHTGKCGEDWHIRHSLRVHATGIGAAQTHKIRAGDVISPKTEVAEQGCIDIEDILGQGTCKRVLKTQKVALTTQ